MDSPAGVQTILGTSPHARAWRPGARPSCRDDNTIPLERSIPLRPAIFVLVENPHPIVQALSRPFTMTGLGRFARGKPSGGSPSAPPSSNESHLPAAAADRMDPNREVTDGSSWMSLTDLNDTTDPSNTSDLSFLADFGLEIPTDAFENGSSMSVPPRTSHATPLGGGLRMFHNKGLAPSQSKNTASSALQTDHQAPSVSAELQTTGPASFQTNHQQDESSRRLGSSEASISKVDGSSHTLNAIPCMEAARNFPRMADMASRSSSAGTAPKVNGDHEPKDDPTTRSGRWQDLAVSEYDNSVFVTANESTRIIPAPSTVEKRPLAGTIVESSTTPGPAARASSTQQSSGSNNMVPPEARRTEPPMASNLSRTDGVSTNQPSGGGPQGSRMATGYTNDISTGFETPGGMRDRRSGNGLESVSLPCDQASVVVTPQHNIDSLALGNYTLESPSPRIVPGMQFTPTHTSDKASLTHTVTPLLPNASDGIATPGDVQQDQGLQEMATNEDDDEEAMSFEELYEKFRSQLQDLDDHQGANGITLLKLQDMFATAYAESLQDQAGLFDLLSSAEKMCCMGDAIISKYEVMM